MYKFHSDIRKKHLPVICLSYLTDKISDGFDSGLLKGIIWVDPQKAFGTIDHNILLQKMPALGVSNEVIDWFWSYLFSRKYFVNNHEKIPTSSNLKCGVVEGSISEPLFICIIY